MRRNAGISVDYSAHQEGGTEHWRLLFNFLRVSPSYALICQSNGQRITRATPETSRRVIQMYRKYGDVYQKCFDQWSGPAVETSAKMTPSEQPLLIAAGQTIECPHGYEGILMPSNIGKREKLRLFALTLPSSRAEIAPARSKEIRSKTLWKALAAVYERAKHPDIELWRIGLLANLVERFNGKIDPWCEKKSAKDSEARRHLTLMVVRALFLALLVSENAAQGVFPDQTPVIGEQLKFPFAEQQLHTLLSAHGDVEYLTVLEHAANRLK